MKYCKRQSRQMKEAEQAYTWLLDSILNDINQVDEKIPYLPISEKEPEWLLNMREIEKLVRAKKNLIK